MQSPHPAQFAELPLQGKCVVLLVQGPLAQSPRMAAQAWALAEAGAQVRFVGFGTAAEFPRPHPRITVHAVAGAGRDMATGSGWPLLRAGQRTLAMATALHRTLKEATRDAGLILAQVPPALPGPWLAARRGVPLAIDWHNLGAPMAALKLGPRHPALGLIDAAEARLARRAVLHFAVTKALAERLGRRCGQVVHTLPDRPLDTCVPALPAAQVQDNDGRAWRTVVSPTSWSRDEEMDMLLEAAARVRLPPGRGLRVVATGQGPQRAAFEARAGGLRRPGLSIETAWLPPAGYAALLAGADAGVSLHRSASGLDFPMKLVDMEAAGLPALALDYGPALRQGLSGLPGARTFTDAAGLAARLQEVLAADAPGHAAPQGETWPALWSRVALPALGEVLG